MTPRRVRIASRVIAAADAAILAWGVICPRAAMHEQQRVAVSDDLDEQGHIPDRHSRHGLTPSTELKRQARAC